MKYAVISGSAVIVAELFPGKILCVNTVARQFPIRKSINAELTVKYSFNLAKKDTFQYVRRSNTLI
jgi:hypothetical protein